MPFEQVKSSLQQLRSLGEHERAVRDASAAAASLLGPFWKDGEAQWDSLTHACESVADLRLRAAQIAASEPAREIQLRESWATVISGTGSLADVESRRRGLVIYRDAYESFCRKRKLVDDLLLLDSDAAWGNKATVDVLATTVRRVAEWIERTSDLRPWCAWQRVRSEGVALKLTPLIDGCERGVFPTSDLKRVFEKGFYQWWHTAVVSSEPVLAQFFSPEHNRKIGQFREADDRYRGLTQHAIAARLVARVPAATEIELANSEVGILKREILRRRRHMPLRKLIQSIPNLLPRLKPCLLMSPISVAQYLEAGASKFDLVIFDEASQVPAWDAVGALGRGKQAVIVGDPKQLPPTSFFSRADDDEGEDPESEVVEDLESILDDAISARLPWRTLNWHYRSRHEGLIAFSNYHYYGNALLTFPSPQREGLGVSWRPVSDGIYDRGKSATNRIEAQAVIAELVRRLKDPQLRSQSIGIVTFSQAQQKLVEDLLEEVRAADPEIDAFFSEEADEPTFVKNLENVQGDERDVILFSICYGPDITGRVAMNFGPMNRLGGERRLNVAITRARREVLVFSTLRAEQIDLARSRARGVRDLKNFLEYAERGPAAIAAASQPNPDAVAESPFEQAVYDALISKGWEVHHQVGCARYRIDLGVVDPRAPGRYLLGIECDGANYHRAKTARDRDKLREGILHDLGWKLHRIWSTDWWMNAEGEIRKLISALEAALKAPAVQVLPAAKTNGPVASRPAFAAVPTSVAPPQRPASSAQQPPTYQPYPVTVLRGSQDTFYESISRPLIQALLIEVVTIEGPISLGLVARRVAAHWGFERIHPKTVKHIEGLLPRDSILVHSSPNGVFLWPSQMRPARYDGFRIPCAENPHSQRDINDLAVEEIANAALHVLRPQISAPHEDIIRETARLLGFQRVGSAVENRIRAGVAHLIANRLAEDVAGRLTLRS